jgi:hypothetical protein
VVLEEASAGVEAAKADGMAAIGIARADDAGLLTAAGADVVVTTLDGIDTAALAQGRLATRKAWWPASPRSGWDASSMCQPPDCLRRCACTVAVMRAEQPADAGKAGGHAPSMHVVRTRLAGTYLCGMASSCPASLPLVAAVNPALLPSGGIGETHGGEPVPSQGAPRR